MYDAVGRVHRADGLGLRLQIELTRNEIPDILLQGQISYLRLLITQENIDGGWIPKIIKANPRLRALLIAIHVSHHGSTSNGNCAFNKIPIIPGLHAKRNSQLHTYPPYELVYSVKDKDKASVKQSWAAYTRSRRGPTDTAEKLDGVNVFENPNWPPQEWDEASLARCTSWEDEVKGWCALSEGLDLIKVALNMDTQKFGRFEPYWCTDRPNYYY